jgi:hypothetical protein
MSVDERAHQLRSLLTTLPPAAQIDSNAQLNNSSNSFNIAQYNAQRLQMRKRALREKNSIFGENAENTEQDNNGETNNNNDNDDENIRRTMQISAMCVLRAGDRVGAVHYDSARHAFLFAEQQLVNSDANADVRAFLHLLPLRANGALDALGATVTSSGGGEQFAFIAELRRSFGDACEHIVIAPSNFSAKNGLRRLELVAQKSTLYVASRIDIENSLLMRCFDGICHLLQKKYQLALFADSLASDARVVAFEHVSLDSLMQLDHNTLVALQIIPHAGAQAATATDDGKAVARDRDRPAVGAPIDSIETLMLLHVSSSIGKTLMRRWIRAPLMQLDAIHQRQRMVQFFAAPARLGVVAQLKHLLGTIKSVAPLVRKISASAKPATLSDIANVRAAAITLVELLRLCRTASAEDSDNSTQQQLVIGLDEIDSAQLQALVEVIERVVDVAAAKEMGRFVVREGIDKELDDLRFFYDGLGVVLQCGGRGGARRARAKAAVRAIAVDRLLSAARLPARCLQGGSARARARARQRRRSLRRPTAHDRERRADDAGGAAPLRRHPTLL